MGIDRESLLADHVSLLAKMRARLDAEIERDPVPATIRDMAKTRVGKPITKRDTNALETLFPGVRFSIEFQSYVVEISWWRANSNGETHERSLLSMDERVRLQRTDLFPAYENRGGLQIGHITPGAKRWESEAWVVASNARYYSARDERNAKRAELLAVGPKADALAQCATYIEAFALIRRDLKATIEDHDLDQAEYIMRDLLKELTGEDIKLW